MIGIDVYWFLFFFHLLGSCLSGGNNLDMFHCQGYQSHVFTVVGSRVREQVAVESRRGKKGYDVDDKVAMLLCGSLVLPLGPLPN